MMLYLWGKDIIEQIGNDAFIYTTKSDKNINRTSALFTIRALSKAGSLPEAMQLNVILLPHASIIFDDSY
jgi:hypothetical protein